MPVYNSIAILLQILTSARIIINVVESEIIFIQIVWSHGQGWRKQNIKGRGDWSCALHVFANTCEPINYNTKISTGSEYSESLKLITYFSLGLVEKYVIFLAE